MHVVCWLPFLFVTINVNLSLCCRHEGACSPLSCTSSNTLCVVRCHVRVIVYMFRILLKQRRQNKKNNRMASHSSLYSRARGVCLLIRYCHLLAVATAHRSKIYIIHNLKLKIICWRWKYCLLRIFFFATPVRIFTLTPSRFAVIRNHSCSSVRFFLPFGVFK